MKTTSSRRYGDMNPYTVFFALSGICALALMVTHFHVPHWPDFIVVLSMTIGLSFFPIRMVNGFKHADGYATATIGYLYLLQYMSLGACLTGMCLEVFILFLRHYKWRVHRIRWFPFLASMGMYLFSAFAVDLYLHWFPTEYGWVRSFLMLLIFDLVNQFLIGSIQPSIGRDLSLKGFLNVWKDIFVPLFVCSTILATVLKPSHAFELSLRCLYASMMLAGIIFLNSRQVRAAERYRSMAVKYAAITENTQDCMVLMDDAYRVTYASPSHRSLLNRLPGDIEHRSLFELIWPDERDTLYQALESVKNASQALTLSIHFSHADGHAVPVELKVAGVPDEEGHIKNLVMIARDQTERIKTEELLRKSERLAVVGQLAAGVAHEVRNPLTSIKGFFQVLEQSPSDLPRFSPIIRSELEHIESIIKEFLVWSKPEFGRREHRNISLLLDTVVSVMSTQAIMNGATIQTDFDPNTPTVWCDDVHMKQVFVNVVKNAIEAMPNGGNVSIRVFAKGQTVHVEVEDEGTGIPPQLLSKVGNPFFTTKQEGTGLGMMVTYKIIQDHDGRIQLDSDGYHGTTVRIELPSSEAVHAPNFLMGKVGRQT